MTDLPAPAPGLARAASKPGVIGDGKILRGEIGDGEIRPRLAGKDGGQ